MADSQVTSVVLPRELYQWLCAEARRQKMSQSKVIVCALMEYRDQKVDHAAPGHVCGRNCEVLD